MENGRRGGVEKAYGYDKRGEHATWSVDSPR